MSTTKKGSKSQSTPKIITYYLISYNVLSFVGWSSILLLTLAHLGFNISPLAPYSPPPSTRPKTTSFLSWMSKSGQHTPSTPSSPFNIPPPKWLLPYYSRTETTYASVGLLTMYVQSVAVLELVHVLLGWVRSPIGTTAMQVASRLCLVWGITRGFKQTRTNPFYTSMVLAWSLTEAIRYPFYAFSILPSSSPPKFLVYLRYTTFFVLYPLGAGSEAGLIWASVHRVGKWGVSEWVRAGLFVIWWPGLYVMYTHMIKQRRKVLTKVPTSKSSHVASTAEAPASDSDVVDSAATLSNPDAGNLVAKRRVRKARAT